MDSDTEEVIALYMYIKRRKKKTKNRRVSVHEILQRRSQLGEYHHLVQELSFHPDKLYEYFRMNEEQFDYILN